MSRIKLNNGLAALIFVACLFSGWSTLLIVTILALLFCEIDDKVKNIIIKVIAFYAGYTLISMGWDLISSGIGLIFDAIEKFVAVINSYLDPIDYISLTKLNSYLFNPIEIVVGLLGQVISYLLTFAKFAFIITILTGKVIKQTPISKKIDEYVSKVVNFINNFGSNVNQNYAQQAYAQQNVQQPMNQTYTQQNINQSQTYNNQNMQ